MAAVEPRVLLVDDQPLLRESLVRHLQQLMPTLQLEIANNGSVAIGLLVEHSVDLLVTEMFLPDMHSFLMLKAIQEHAPLPKTIVLCCGATAECQVAARQLGVQAILNKRIDVDTFQRSVLRVIKGESVYEPFAARGQQCSTQSTPELTPREFQVLLHLAGGLSNKQIESRLNISASTLKSHLSALFGKFSVCNRTACVVSARQVGLI